MIWTILSYIIWVLYLSIEGLREANFRHLRRKNAKTEINLVKLCNIQRFFVLLLITFALFIKIGWWGIPIMIPLILISPIFHNGTYFYLRNKLNPNIFKDKSQQDLDNDDEKPSIYLKFKLRKRLAILALILQFIICFIR